MTANGVEQRIKISKAEVLSDNKEFDSNDENDWTNSSLMKYLNGEYYNNSLVDENSRNMIDESVIWSIGEETDGVDDLVTKWYERERSTIRGTDNLYPHEWSSTNTAEEVAFHGIGLIHLSGIKVVLRIG